MPEAIESCRTTKAPHEIIVVDDGSTDGTAEWLAGQEDLITITTENRGKDAAVNTGFAKATGAFVRFLDSDDWLERGASDAQLEIAARTGADVVLAHYRAYDQRTHRSRDAVLVPNDDFIAQQLGEGECSHYSAFIYRRSFVQDIPHRAEFLAADDRMFILEVALRRPKLATYDGVALVHVHHDRGRLQAPPPEGELPIHKAELQAYRTAIAELAARGELTDRRRRASAARLWPLAHRMARHDPEEAARLVEWIYELDPYFRVPDVGVVPALYRLFGFRTTSRLLKFRRSVAHAARAARASARR